MIGCTHPSALSNRRLSHVERSWAVASRIIIVQGLLISVAFKMIKPSSWAQSEHFVFSNSSPEE